MDKLFTIAGTSTLDGVNTYRFATGKINVRTAKLKRHGHTDVDLIELPTPMNKADAIAHLVTQGRSAVLPTNRKDKPVELTDEQKAAADEAAKKAAFVARMKAAREAKQAARVAAEDHNFLAGLTGGAMVPVPEDDGEPLPDAETPVVEAGVDELMAAVGGGDSAELGVDVERELAEDSVVS